MKPITRLLRLVPLGLASVASPGLAQGCVPDLSPAAASDDGSAPRTEWQARSSLATQVPRGASLRLRVTF